MFAGGCLANKRRTSKALRDAPGFQMTSSVVINLGTLLQGMYLAIGASGVIQLPIWIFCTLFALTELQRGFSEKNTYVQSLDTNDVHTACLQKIYGRIVDIFTRLNRLHM